MSWLLHGLYHRWVRTSELPTLSFLLTRRMPLLVAQRPFTMEEMEAIMSSLGYGVQNFAGFFGQPHDCPIWSQVQTLNLGHPRHTLGCFISVNSSHRMTVQLRRRYRTALQA
eukprot:SAG31_NODE_4968_length_2828_cov_2.448882_1_plen_111_part_10